jgi:hypothetical protein
MNEQLEVLKRLTLQAYIDDCKMGSMAWEDFIDGEHRRLFANRYKEQFDRERRYIEAGNHPSTSDCVYRLLTCGVKSITWSDGT